MDNQTSPLLNWTYFYQEKSMDELRQSVVLTMELEDTKLKVQEDLKMRDEQISHLKELIKIAIKERDEAQDKCQKVLYQKLILQNKLQNISSNEDEPIRVFDSNNGFASSDCDESIVSSPHHFPPPVPPPEVQPELPLVVDRPLPEKGKLLEAVMKAGPLLQTLLVAGPLPQWRHPPPPFATHQIPSPPLMIPSPPGNNTNKCGNLDRKRGLSEGSDMPMEMKYQRIVLQ